MIPPVSRLVADTFNILNQVSRISRNWFVAYSGGKDSTVLLDLVVRYMERHGGIRATVVYNDVLLDPPPLYQWVYDVLQAVSGKLDTYVIVPKQDFLQYVFEKKYGFPGFFFTWCTTELKRKPLSRFANQMGLHEKKWIKLTGVRLDESLSRRRAIEKRRHRNAVFLQRSRRGFIDAAPLINWSLGDIKNYLLNNNPPWSNSLTYEFLVNKVYCGDLGLRIGCWICTLVRKDRMLIKYAETHGDSRYLKIMELKNKLFEISISQKYREYKSKKLNKEGIEKCRLILLEIFRTIPELLKPYATHRLHVIEQYLPELVPLMKTVEPYTFGKVNIVIC